MNPSIPTTALQLRSLVQADGTLQISLEPTPVPTPGPDEVLIQVQATMRREERCQKEAPATGLPHALTRPVPSHPRGA